MLQPQPAAEQPAPAEPSFADLFALLPLQARALSSAPAADGFRM
jgi:hypothetical protein